MDKKEFFFKSRYFKVLETDQASQDLLPNNTGQEAQKPCEKRQLCQDFSSLMVLRKQKLEFGSHQCGEKLMSIPGFQLRLQKFTP